MIEPILSHFEHLGWRSNTWVFFCFSYCGSASNEFLLITETKLILNTVDTSDLNGFCALDPVVTPTWQSQHRRMGEHVCCILLLLMQAHIAVDGVHVQCQSSSMFGSQSTVLVIIYVQFNVNDVIDDSV